MLIMYEKWTNNLRIIGQELHCVFAVGQSETQSKKLARKEIRWPRTCKVATRHPDYNRARQGTSNFLEKRCVIPVRVTQNGGLAVVYSIFFQLFTPQSRARNCFARLSHVNV
eukprot:sb/3477024/